MTDFPMDIMIFNKIVEVFNKTRSYVLLLFPLAFFIRIAFGFILLKGPESFTDILKDSLFLFLGLFFFADILKLTLQIPYLVSQELEYRKNKGPFLKMAKYSKVLIFPETGLLTTTLKDCGRLLSSFFCHFSSIRTVKSY